MAKSFVSPWHMPLPGSSWKAKGLLNLPSNSALEVNVRKNRQLLNFSKGDRTRVTCGYEGSTAVRINHHDVTRLEEVTNGKAFEDDSDVLIECRNIHKSFGEKQILRGVNLKVRYGEAVGIIGPSGTGKSTILKIMTGLLAPDKGEVYICGKKRQGLISDEEMSGLRVGLVFQSAALFDSLTVRENVGFMLYEHSNLPHERIAELVTETLEAVGLKGVEDRLPSELSGGMKKRVALARAIIFDDSHHATEPEVVMYDEPTAGLDPIASTVVEDLIRSVHIKGCDAVGKPGKIASYVVVTHQHSTIKRAIDRQVLTNGHLLIVQVENCSSLHSMYVRATYILYFLPHLQWFGRLLFLYEGRIVWEGMTHEFETSTNPIVRQFAVGSLEGPIQY